MLLVHRFLKGAHHKSLIALMGGTAFAQLLMLGASPVLTRIYRPSDFGDYALFTVMCSIISVLACLRYDVAIVLPKEEREARHLFVLSVAISAGMGLSLYLLFVLFDRLDVPYMHQFIKRDWYGLVPFITFLLGIFQASNYLLTRNQSFHEIALAKTVQSASSIAAQIGSGYALHAGSKGLIFGQMFGQLCANALMLRKAAGKGAISRKQGVRFQAAKQLLKRYREFPLYNTLPSLLDIVSISLPLFFITSFYGNSVAGHYSLANRIVNIPLILIGSALSQVVFQKLAELHANGQQKELEALVLQSLKRLAVVSVLAAAVFQSSPSLFRFVFGDTWSEAGHYAQMLAVAAAVRLAVSPLSNVLIVREKQKTLAVWQLLYVVTTSLSLCCSAAWQSPDVTIFVYAVNEALMYFIYLLLILKTANVSVFKKRSA